MCFSSCRAWRSGIIVAAPIGPVNLICIRRTLAFGPLNGFLSGLGAALGDGVFGIVTAFGLTAIAQLIKGFYVPLQVVGGHYAYRLRRAHHLLQAEEAGDG